MKKKNETPNLKSEPVKNSLPLNLSKERKNAIDLEAVEAMRKLLSKVHYDKPLNLTPIEYQSNQICKAIYEGKILRVRFVYEQN